ncbi:sigma-70 family RNA polymerase sigma factor [uncultured Muribaculum sp.]|uniref:RNA polymerase sigma factor n=1 Tax=uncultured Muribaculum sp. TaxID=1918613 RepID=UPI0025D0D251|nr:sigma-70 family RNA polymerase sigma factor [uncultured Muribaculum sp.]
MAETEESRLILELRADSVKAFNELYRMYVSQLYYFSLRYTKSACDAEEIVHDVFVRLWNMRRHVKATATLRPLLFVMAKHYLINAMRSNVASRTYEDYLAYSDTVADNSSQKIEYDDFCRQLTAALNKLPATQRDSIVLSRFEGKSVDEISVILNVSKQTVYNSIHLGLKRLKGLLGDIILLAVVCANEIFTI